VKKETKLQNLREPFLAIFIAISLTASLTILPIAHASPGYWNSKPSTTWTQTITPGPYIDKAYCTATWGDYVYIAGYHNISGQDTEFLVYKISKSTGEIIQRWSLNPSSKTEAIYDCKVIGNYLYAVGMDNVGSHSAWNIFRFDAANLSNYIRIRYGRDTWWNDEWAWAVATNGTYIYVAAKAYDNNGYIRMFTMDLKDTGYYYDWDGIYGIDDLGVNPKTGQVWFLRGNLLVLLTSNLNWIKTVNLPTSSACVYETLTFDPIGNAYAATGNTLYMLSPDGVILRQASLPGMVSKLLVISDYVYAIASTNNGQAIFILDRWELRPVASYTLQGQLLRGASFDNSSIYIGGYTSITGSDADWILFKVDPLVSRIHLVVRGTDDGIYYRWMTSSWSQWVKLPGLTPDSPATADNGSSLLLGVRGKDSGIWFSWIRIQTGEFSGWQQLPGFTPSRPAIAPDVPGKRIFFVVRGMDNGIYLGNMSLATGAFNYVKLAGSTPNSPSAVVLNGRLYIVVSGSDGGIYFGQVDLSSGKWLGWSQLSGMSPSAPSLASDGSNLYLAVRGGDNGIYIKTWSGAWGPWEKIPTGVTQTTPTITWYNGALYIFVQGTDNAIYYCVRLGSEQYSRWTKLDGLTPSPPATATP